MNRSEKEAFVNEFTSEIQKAQAFALLSFSKISVEKMTSFRLSLRKKNVRVQVVKNTLAKRALEGTPYKDLCAQLVGTTLIAYGPDDPVVTAKAIWEWASKEDYGLKVKSGAALGQVMSQAQIKALSQLPGKNELFVGFLWALKSGPTKFLYALQDTPRKLGYALGALQNKKEKEGVA